MKKLSPYLFSCIFLVLSSMPLWSTPKQSSILLPGYSEPVFFSEPSANIRVEDNEYPKIDLTGFIETKLSGRDYSESLTKLESIRNDAYFQKLPLDVLKGDPILNIRYLLSLEGQLSEDLFVRYDIEKEPNFPGRYNILVQKDRTELAFGDQQVFFTKGEFMNIKKSINGVRLSSTTDNWNGQAVIAKSKSDPQKFETFGNGSQIYKLNKQYILEGSVRIYINNKTVLEQTDYVVDYYNGLITFTRPKTVTDYIQVIYEFTDPVQDFLPSLSQKNILGADYTWRPDDFVVESHRTEQSTEETLLQAQAVTLLSSEVFQTTQLPIAIGSETILINDRPLSRNIDYSIKYQSGKILFNKIILNPGDKLRIKYTHYITEKSTDIIAGQSHPGPYYLQHGNIMPETLSISVDTIPAREFIDYLVSPQTGRVVFQYPIQPNQLVVATYSYQKSEFMLPEIEASPISAGFSFFQENSTNDSDILAPVVDETPNISTDRTILHTLNTPINELDPIIVKVDGVAIASNQYSVDAYTGQITLASPANGIVTVSYSYAKAVSTTVSFQASGLSSYESNINFKLPNAPVMYNGVWNVVLYRNGQEIYLESSAARKDYEVEYSENGQKMVIKFLSGSGSYFSSYPPIPNSGDTITISYYYTPSLSLSQGESEQRIINLFTNIDVNPNWHVKTEYASSYYLFSKGRSDFTETLALNSKNADNTYSLTHSPIVKDSEVVKINNLTMTAETDYYVNYEQGTIRFLNQNYDESTVVRISYQYFANDIPESKTASAIHLSSDYKVSDSLDISNLFTYMDPNFRSIGQLLNDPGTRVFNNTVSWKMSPTNSVIFDYGQTEKLSVQNTRNKLEHRFQTDAALQMGPFQSNHKFRYFDRITTENYIESDLSITSYEPEFALIYDYGKTVFKGTLSHRMDEDPLTFSKTNTVVKGYGITQFWTPQNLLWMKAFSVSPYFETLSEKVVLENDQIDRDINFFGIRYSTNIIDGLNNSSAVEKKIIETQSSENVIVDTFYNYNSKITFFPVHWLDSHYLISHTESVGAVAGKENLVENYSTFEVTTVKPFFLLKQFSNTPILYQPFLGSTGFLNTNQTARRNNDAQQQLNQNTLTLRLANFEPVNRYKLIDTTASWKDSLFTDSAQYSYQLFSSSDTTFRKLESTGTIQEKLWFFNPVQYQIHTQISDADSLTTQIESSSLDNNSTQNNLDWVIDQTISYTNDPIQFWGLDMDQNQVQYQWIDLNKKNNQYTRNYLNDVLTDTQTSQKDQTLNSDKWTVSSILFKQFKVSTSLENKDEYFNRNIIATGSLFKDSVEQNISVAYSPFSFLNTDWRYSDYSLDQFSDDQLNRSISALKNTPDSTLDMDKKTYGLTSTTTPFSFISIINSANYKTISQKSTLNPELSSFKETLLGSGLVFHLFQDLHLKYMIYSKQLEDKNTQYRGYQDLWSIEYTPLNFKNYSVNINISKESNGGYGFNEITQDLSLISTNESVSYSILNRKDSILLGSINLNIELPLDTIQYLEALQISGEGYVKYIHDQKDSNNTLFISGFLLKTTLRF